MQNARVLHASVARLSILLSLASAILMVYDTYAIFMVTGFLALAIMSIPGCFGRSEGLFSLWNFTILNAFIGLTLRGVFIYMEWPDAETIDFYYLQGLPADYFFLGSFAVILGVMSITFGFFIGGSRRPFITREWQFSVGRVYWCVGIIFLVAIYGSVKYIGATGGLFEGVISGKRTAFGLDDLNSAKTFGIYRQLASFAFFGHLLMMREIYKRGARGAMMRRIVAIVMFALACVVPFYGSSRTPIAIYMLTSMGYYYFLTHKLPKLGTAVLGLFTLVVLGVMGVLRRFGSSATLADFLSFSTFQSIVIDRNNISLAKTSHILDSIPNLLPFQFGDTMWPWLLAWVPRSIWTSKPFISSGSKEIGSLVYGNSIAGVPPGLVAELFWNFNWFGVIFGGLLVGFLMKYIQSKFDPYVTKNSTAALLYVVGPMQFGFLAIGHSIGYGVFNVFLNTAVMFLLIKFVSSKSPQRRV